MGRLIDEGLIDYIEVNGGYYADKDEVDELPTVEAIPKDNVYKAIREIMKYEHEGFINISLARLDEILKKYGVSEDENDTTNTESN